jgi:hypothetical protein
MLPLLCLRVHSLRCVSDIVSGYATASRDVKRRSIRALGAGLIQR